MTGDRLIVDTMTGSQPRTQTGMIAGAGRPRLHESQKCGEQIVFLPAWADGQNTARSMTIKVEV
jgi:hypothetical protein